MGNSSASTFVLIALMVVAFYFLIIRPNKKRQQAQQATLRSLTPGTRVLLNTGVFGRIVEIGEKQAVLEISPGAHLTVLKQAIARAVQPSDEDTEWESIDDEDPEDVPEGFDSDVRDDRDTLTADPTTTHHDVSLDGDGPPRNSASAEPPLPGTDPLSGRGSTPIRD